MGTVVSRANALEIYNDGTATLPGASVSEITSRGNAAIATKGYVDDMVAAGGGGWELTLLFDGSSTPANNGDTIDWSASGYDYDDFDMLMVTVDFTGLTPNRNFGAMTLIPTASINVNANQGVGLTANAGFTGYAKPVLEFDTTSKTDATIVGDFNVADVNITAIYGVLI